MTRTPTFADWKTKLFAQIWPSGPPENVLDAINSMLISGCMELQRTIECLQVNNTTVTPFCATFFNSGLTWVDAPGPMAVIRRIYTIANGHTENKVWYYRREHKFLLDLSQNCLSYIVPANTGLPALPTGDRYAEAATDKYSTLILPLGATNGRARRGWWSLDRRRLYIGPWMQSNETLCVEWDGVKQSWLDTDLVDLDLWSILHEECLKWYIKWQYQANYGADRVAEQSAEKNFKEKFADLINDCTKYLHTRHDDPPPTYSATTQQLQNEQVSTDIPTTTFAVIGRYGTDDANELAVANAVKGWSPTDIVTVGGNNLGNATDLAAWDARVGKYFQAFIFPYTGLYGVGGQQNAFWPALNDAEMAGLSQFLEYFKALSKRRYYTTVIGDVQIFVLNTAVTEPDGISAGSVQGRWLQAALALSGARWKVVLMNRSPYSSGPTGSNVTLQWPFQVWGANLVISGGETHYERLAVAGLPYIVLGSGGATPLTNPPFVSISPSSTVGNQVFYTGPVPGHTYAWNPNGGIYQLVNGSVVLNVAGTFVAQSSSAVVSGVDDPYLGALYKMTLDISQALNFTVFGALKVSATNKGLTVTFHDTAGNAIDSVVIQ